MPDLASTLKLQIDKLEQLQACLESELHLISSRDAEALISLLQGKEVLLDQIRQQDQTIETLYQQLPDSQHSDDELDSLFAKAKEMVVQCKYRTEINAKAVEQGQLRLAHLRNLLLESRAKESLTYDKSGKTRGMSSGKETSA